MGRTRIWNWQRSDWPQFTYDSRALENAERTFLHNSGLLFGAYRHLTDENQSQLKVDLMSTEALKTSEIEGEYLDRDSLQSSIRQHFGLGKSKQQMWTAETGIADLMMNLYKSYNKKLSHQMLYRWHSMLTFGRTDLKDKGRYRTFKESMQVVSGPLHKPRVHFEAPPSSRIKIEMDSFIHWFCNTAPGNKTALPILIRAGIAHLYFVCIHPFEDGNGRIGRAVSEKALSQGFGQPTLIALSAVINKSKKKYYGALEQANKHMEITRWLEYFSDTVQEALHYTRSYIDFLISKTKLFDKLEGKINFRQKKCLLKMFEQGPDGFIGGLSAEKYIKITQATRPTATRDLGDLVAKDALTKVGERKSTRYFLKVKTLK